MSWPPYLLPGILKRNSDGTFVRLDGGKGPPVLLVPRSELSFERLRLAGDLAKTRAALRLKLAEARGYLDPRIRVVRAPLNPAEAIAWCWDGANASKSFKSRLLLPPSIPEPMFYSSVEAGARLLRCIEGFEGQIWREGSLRISRWWPVVPDRIEWLTFLRSAQQPVEAGADQTPAPIAEPLRAGRSGIFRAIDPDPENLVRQFSPGRVAVAASVAVAAVTGVLGAQYIVVGAQAAALEGRYAKIVAANQPMIEARTRALGLRAEAVAAAARIPQHNALDVLGGFLAAASFENATVETVRFNDRTFEARLAPKKAIDAVALIAQLERIEGLIDVSAAVDPRNGSITVRAGTVDFISGETDAGN